MTDRVYQYQCEHCKSKRHHRASIEGEQITCAGCGHLHTFDFVEELSKKQFTALQKKTVAKIPIFDEKDNLEK